MANPYPADLTMMCDAPDMFNQDNADQVVMVGRVQRPGIVNSVEYVPNWNLNGADTNTRTLTLFNRGPAGAGTAQIATLALTNGVNLAKFVPKVITVTPANASVLVGDILEWVTTASGTGLADPGGKVIVQQSFGQ